MSTFDWDEFRRRKRVRQNGSERSEYLDITQEIAQAKGCAHYKGKWSVPCPKCGAYVPEGTRNSHVEVCKGAVSLPITRSLYDARSQKKRSRRNKAQHPLRQPKASHHNPVKNKPVNHQARFREWALRSAGVTELSFDGKVVLRVRLQALRYITVQQVTTIAEYLASEYATRANIKYAACYIYRDDTLYAKGRYWVMLTSLLRTV